MNWKLWAKKPEPAKIDEESLEEAIKKAVAAQQPRKDLLQRILEGDQRIRFDDAFAEIARRILALEEVPYSHEKEDAAWRGTTRFGSVEGYEVLRDITSIGEPQGPGFTPPKPLTAEDIKAGTDHEAKKRALAEEKGFEEEFDHPIVTQPRNLEADQTLTESLRDTVVIAPTETGEPLSEDEIAYGEEREEQIRGTRAKLGI